MLARELRIGRPDLPRQYDDGGLVDVNNVPVGVLAELEAQLRIRILHGAGGRTDAAVIGINGHRRRPGGGVAGLSALQIAQNSSRMPSFSTRLAFR